jgi:hypothetical protein
MYDDFSSANEAIRDLVNNGFNRSDISIMANDQSGEYSRYLQHSGEATEAPESGAATGAGVGAGIGAVVGGLAGILVGLGALAIPGIGPVLAAGPLAAAFAGLAGAGAGAVAGGVTGGLIGALADMGVPRENAGYFAEGVRRGGTLVVARATEEMAGTARDILNRHSPIDMNERISQWRQSGWTGYHESEGADLTSVGTTTDADFDSDYASTEASTTIPHTGSDTEYNRQSYQQTHEDVDTSPRDLDQTTEELAHHHDMNETSDTSTSNRYDPSMSQTGSQPMESNTSPSYGYSDYTSYQDSFHNHFDNSMYAGQYSYDQYEPAYRYGYDLATNSRYHDRDWVDIENEAHGYWDERNPGTWDRIKDAVRYAWEEVKSAVD